MSFLSSENHNQVEQHLISMGVLTPESLAAARTEAESHSQPLFEYLMNEALIDDEQLTKATANVTGVPYVNLSESEVNPEMLKLLSKDVAERFMAIPLGEMQNRLVVAMLDANNVQAVDYLSTKIGRPLKVYLASASGIRSVLERYETNVESDVSKEFSVSKESAADTFEKDQKEIKTLVQDSPISRALSTILEYAVKTRASDIHIEPLKNELKIRTRVDGVMSEIMRLPKSIEPALVSRIKILATLKIDEHRLPQDGQFTVQVMNRTIDLRIAIAPIVWGEQVVIRILDKGGTSLLLEDMGYRGRSLKAIRKGMKMSNGMILTSGPTGSGKSTSMYAIIQEIMDDAINIVTLEDPVEYKMEGVNQIQINTGIGLTFASGLRSVLRQDPDVVMVGEIRDAETATLAVQAALTGHLVLSTLHTNSAAGVLPRLLDMGIEPFLIASTVNTVIGQRLVRRVDSTSVSEHQSEQADSAAIRQTLGKVLPAQQELVEKVSKELGYEKLPLNTDESFKLYEGKDVKGSPGGYKGRLGLYEVMDVNEEIEKLIINRATSSEIQRAAQESQGMITMRQDGYLKALNGETTVNEVNRVASEGSV